MWVVRGRRMLPLLPFGPPEQPWHSCQYPSLPEIYVQNASLEIAWARVVEEQGTISGVTVMPFITEGYEGFDVNNPRDWLLAKEMAVKSRDFLPAVNMEPFQ
jgi:N-acylneuraminate cytidylyltransferase